MSGDAFTGDHADRFFTAEVGDETFLLDEITSATYRLGGEGGRLWELLTTGMSVADAARVVSVETDEDYERVLGDANRFMGELRASGLLADQATPQMGHGGE